MSELLNNINCPADLKNLTVKQLEKLSAEIRQELVSVVTVNGGHLASSLGAVELTIALHRVFNSPEDKIIWDVGHQSYAHKLLTGRKNQFNTIRQYGGLSGFPSRDESPHDPFGVGHASTSVSAAMGMAKARDLAGEDYHVIAVIGDGAATGGMALEAFNNLPYLGSKLIVILNDNGMSISPTVGALSKIFSKVRFDKRYYKASEKSKRILDYLPLGKKLWEFGDKIKSSIKGFVMPTTIWEEFGMAYMGPIDGHNIKDLETALIQARDYNHKPTLIHISTTKGKGYTPAEGNAVYFHGVSPKCKVQAKTVPTYSEVFAQTVLQLARQEPKLVVITPAMPEGNCLSIVQNEFPDRVFDVGICEQHAVTFAAGLATQGYIPVVAIYSTFLQRSFDQIIHDVCLQDLQVIFAIDRGGIVGDDGKTHQGIFDLSYLSLIPNLIVSAPKDENELQHLLYTATQTPHPMAIRYPRSCGTGIKMDDMFKTIPMGTAEILKEGNDVAIMAVGASVPYAIQAAGELSLKGIEATVINGRFIKPLGSEVILDTARKIKYIVTVEENVLIGGFGSAVSSLLHEAGITDTMIKKIGIPDRYVEHGTPKILREKYGLDSEGIIKETLTLLPEVKRIHC
ncbi:MAG: 1-deoxy-D-xylulose-5-phosphate synthase [Dehalococcoidales bacterium]|jgi:1-deoxy-D-xylulose-5-phosphate synthase|nr:1-deoxy-D-xylulose-5-phosphate synthase [Dehalococcoidales bacterium]